MILHETEGVRERVRMLSYCITPDGEGLHEEPRVLRDDLAERPFARIRDDAAQLTLAVGMMRHEGEFVRSVKSDERRGVASGFISALSL